MRLLNKNDQIQFMKLMNTFTKEEIKDISHTDFNNWLNLTKQQKRTRNGFICKINTIICL